MLESRSPTSSADNVTYAAIVDTDGHRRGAQLRRRSRAQPTPEHEDLTTLVDATADRAAQAVYSGPHASRSGSRCSPATSDFGSIRIGVSTLLVRDELQRGAQAASAYTAVVALVVSTLVAMLLAQWMLRPIHVIQSGLTRLGRGELDVRLDLPGQEFADLGSSFEAVSAQLSAVARPRRCRRRSSSTDFESVMDNLEDAVALFSPEGELMFCNPRCARCCRD